MQDLNKLHEALGRLLLQRAELDRQIEEYQVNILKARLASLELNELTLPKLAGKSEYDVLIFLSDFIHQKGYDLAEAYQDAGTSIEEVHAIVNAKRDAGELNDLLADLEKLDEAISKKIADHIIVRITDLDNLFWDGFDDALSIQFPIATAS